jgi:hypothetical protein
MNVTHTAAACLLLGLGQLGASAVPVYEPAFTAYTARPSGQATVFGVASTTAADIVVLNNGLDQGLRTGAICDVSRSGEPIAELILIDVREDRAAALITALQPNAAIHSGDLATLQTSSSN